MHIYACTCIQNTYEFYMCINKERSILGIGPQAKSHGVSSVRQMLWRFSGMIQFQAKGQGSRRMLTPHQKPRACELGADSVSLRVWKLRRPGALMSKGRRRQMSWMRVRVCLAFTPVQLSLKQIELQSAPVRLKCTQSSDTKVTLFSKHFQDIPRCKHSSHNW